MKRIIALMTAIIIAILPIHNSYGEEYETYEGIPDYSDLYQNIRFNDIRNHWAKDSIYKMAALSVIREMGERTFRPDNRLTKEQALALIVRALGLENEAQRLGEETVSNLDTGGYKILTSTDYWSNGYIQVALNEGIINQDEINEIETINDTEETSLELRLIEEMEDYYINPDLTENQLANIENQINEKLRKQYTWNKDATREQVAIWVGRALGLEPVYGQAQQKIYNLKDWQSIDTQYIPYIESILQKGIMEGNGDGYFLPKSHITRGEMARILDNIHEELLINRGFVIKTGVIDKIEDSYQWNEDVKAYGNLFTIKNDDNTMSVISTLKTEDETNDKGFIVYKSGNIGTPEELDFLDYIKYYIDPNKQVVFVESLDNKDVTIEGFIEEIDTDNNTIVIKDFNDNNHILNVLPGTDIRINNQWAEANDLLYGQEVEVKINNGNVISITGNLDLGEEGYIHPGERITVGKILYVDRDNEKITVVENNKYQDYIVYSFTPVIKNGIDVGISGIREGDVVRLEFDQYNGNTPIRVYVGEPDKQIVNLFKGKVTQYNPNRNEIILSDVSYYDNTRWEKKAKSIKLPLANNSDIYFNGEKISKENLSSYTGREAYIVTADNFGSEEIFRLVLKNGYERNYYNTIQDIAFGDKKLMVDYNEMYFDDSTIIVKDGKLIHSYNLKEDDNIFVIAHGNGNYNASFISVENVEAPMIMVYRGRIDEIMEYGFELDNFDILEGTEWDYTSRQTEFEISEDTKIIDTRDIDVKEVSVKEFTNSRFLKDEDRDNYYEEYAYAVEYGDMILAINIIDEDDEAQVISLAEVKSVDTNKDRITLKNIRDWSDFREQWNINDAEIQLNLKDSIIIKNGKVVDINEIQKEDSLYVLRRNSDGYIVVVR